MPPAREGYGRAYPGPVSRHNLVCSFLFLWYLVPFWDRFATMVAVGVFVDTGPPKTWPWEGDGQSGRGECMTKGGFRRDTLVHPNGSARLGIP